MCSTEVYLPIVKGSTNEENKGDTASHFFVERATNISKLSTAQISCVEPDIVNNKSEVNECDGFKTPPDTFDIGIQYHNIDQPNIHSGQLGVKKAMPKNTLDYTPRKIGMITLRRVNLYKPFSKQLCMVTTPVVCPRPRSVLASGNSFVDRDTAPSSNLEIMNSSACLQTPSSFNKNGKTGCESLKDIAHIPIKKQITWEEVFEPEMARLPAFVPINEYTETFCSSDHSQNNNCVSSVHATFHLSQNAIEVDSENYQSLSVRSRHAVASKELSNISPICPNVSQTIITSSSCDNLIESSDLTNVEFSNRQEGSKHMQELPDGVVEFKAPTVPVQSRFIIKQMIPQLCQKASPQRSYSCGNVSISSFDDNSFSPVQIILPPESPEEVANVNRPSESLLITSDKATEKENQNMIISSDYKIHYNSDEKVQLESVQDKKSGKKKNCTAGLKQCNNTDKNKSNEIKLKVPKTSATKAKNSLKVAGICESYGQRQTRSLAKRVTQNCLAEGQSTESGCDMDRSERILRLMTSSNGKDSTHPQVANCSENPQSIASSDFVNPVTDVCRSKRMINTDSRVQSLEAMNSETVTNSINITGKEVTRRKSESVKNKKQANSIKDDNIAEISTQTQKYKKKGQRIASNSSVPGGYTNEMTVSKMSQICEKPDKKTSKADKGFNSLCGSGSSKTFDNLETKSSMAVNTASKLTRRANSLGIGSRKLCSSVTLHSDKEQRKSLRAGSKCLVSKCSPTKSKLLLDDNFDNQCEDSNADEIRSYIHPQSSFSELQSGRIKSSKITTAAPHNKGKITLNSKRKSAKPPEECDKNFKSSFDQSFERTSHQDKLELRDIKMPQKQLRKRKNHPVVTEVLPDKGSKIKASVTTRSKIKPEKKLAEVNALNIQEEHVKISKRVKKSSKRESFLEVALGNANAEKNERIIIEEQQGEMATTAVATKKSIKKNDVRARKKLSKNKAEPKCEENTFSTIKLASQKFVGAHCSIAGGVSNAVKEAASIGARSFGLFVRNGRTWKLNKVDVAEAYKFKETCKELGFLPHLILPHGSYLLNCGSSNPDTLQKSRDTLIHELQICELLGLELYNFHPGSACGKGSVNDCLKTVSESINIAHQKTDHIKTVIENMSCQGSTVGGRFEELKAIIDGVTDKSRIGVCLDTCHAFAAGFDLSSESGFNKCIEDFDKIVGLQYLCAMHLNDSKGQLGCHLDRHENIGRGHIGIEGFRCVMNDPRLNNIPMILETPVDDYAKEIKILCELENL